MRELSIKIRIADREYPMTVPSSDEQRLRVAGRLINEKIKTFKETFGIDDKQDLLSMVAFDVMVERLKAEELNNETNEILVSKLDELNHLIDHSLK
ncbi:MAG: cell division protein ZapA [Cytophagales bacterium]|nr:MAG: cell division protein ZapA [Cytophagales bacterium]